MKLAFFPGDLHLNRERDGDYVITMQGVEILRSRVEKKAVTKFNTLRRELEAQFPAREMTPQEKRAALERYIGDFKAAEVRASTKPPKKDKVKGTRTFG
jgi:hypothetical protein